MQELVELVLSDLKRGSEVGADVQQTCLEVGCGSGAISLSLLKSLPQVGRVCVALVALFLLHVWISRIPRGSVTF